MPHVILASGDEIVYYNVGQYHEIGSQTAVAEVARVGVFGDSIYAAIQYSEELALFERFPHLSFGGKENEDPQPDFTILPDSGTTNTVFVFDASTSQDAETPTNQLKVRWDWESDGTYDTDFSTDKIAEHSYSFDGPKQITLQVQDGFAVRSSIIKDIQVSVGIDAGSPPDSSNSPYQIPYPIDEALFVPGQKDLYLTSGATQKVFILNLESGLIEKEFAFDFLPESITINPSGDRVFVALWTGEDRSACDEEVHPGVIAVFDTETQAKIDQFLIEDSPADIAVNDDGYLFVAGAKRNANCRASMASYHVESRQLTARDEGVSPSRFANEYASK